MKKLFIILTCIGIGSSAFAQEKSTREKKGDKQYFVYSFEKSIDYYSNTKNLTPEGQRRLAESYYNINQNFLAEEAYSKLISTNQGLVANDYFVFARLLKANGKNDQSLTVMDKFAELNPNDLRAKDYVANKSKLAELTADGGKYKIQAQSVNTDDDDFGPIYYKDKIIFSSTNSAPKMIVKNYNWTGKPFWNIFIADVEDGQLKNAKVFDKSLNGNLHDGPASFSNDGTFMAFTRNNYKDKSTDKVVELQIHFSTFTDGKWSKSEPFFLNNSEYSVGHPSLTANGKTMYFTSDMSGGFGGSDIYRTTKNDDGTWNKAENMGDKINTESDEMFPFIEENSQKLYFSSNGRFGLGGLDVFVTDITGSIVGNVQNAGFPLNTLADDYAVIVNSTSTKGYVSSDRAGGLGGDDIYAFDITETTKTEQLVAIEKRIEGIAKDKNETPLTNTYVTLFDDKGMVLDTFTTQTDGAFTFAVETNKNFTLTGKKEKYNDGFTDANTLSDVAIVKADIILLTKKEVVAQKVKVGEDLGKIVEFNPIYFDYDKYDIRKDAKSELAKIIEVMNDYPNMVVELGAHTDCRANNAYNQNLSNQRAKETADYVKKSITNPSRISGKGYGETKLLTNCPCSGDVISECSEAEHQKNRRTEFIIKSTGKITMPEKLTDK
ncbi:MAG: OmpA family protein [Bacteroidetes bacterium]|nr:OmpA family protein [Bacteroidota bacterium]